MNIIKDIVEWQEYKTWFEPIVPIELKDNALLIQVPSQFFYEYLEEHYVSLLQKTLIRTLGRGAKLEYRIMIDSGLNSGGTTDIPGGVEKSRSDNSVELPWNFNKEKSVMINPFAAPGITKFKIDS